MILIRELKKEKEFAKINGKISANVSLISMILIVSLPFLTPIDFLLPFKITLALDILGLIIAFSLISPKKERLEKKDKKSLSLIIKEAKEQKFFSIAIFTGAIIGFSIAESSFRTVYLVFSGLPLVYLGFAMGFSRLIWFIVGHNIHRIQNIITMKQHLKFEMIFFPFYYLLLSFSSNSYLILILMIIGIGYMWGREKLIQSYILENYISNQNYKATVLSIRGQFSSLIQFLVVFLIGFVMNYSLKLGYLTLGIVLFLILSTSYYFISKH